MRVTIATQETTPDFASLHPGYVRYNAMSPGWGRIMERIDELTPECGADKFVFFSHDEFGLTNAVEGTETENLARH